MKNILNMEIKLKQKELKEGYKYCDVCSGISWVLDGEDCLVKCKCMIGQYQVCKICNENIPNNYVSCPNDGCREVKEENHVSTKIKNAIKIDITHALVDSFGMLYSDIYPYNEGYFSDIEDFKEHISDNDLQSDPKSGNVWSTSSYGYDLDIDNVIDNSLDDHYEDARDHLVGLCGLERFVSKWVEKQDIKTYFVDYKYYIQLN